MATKIPHAGICYLIKESLIKIHIPGQDGDFRQCTGLLAISSSVTTHIIHKSHFNCEYITVEYKQPSFVNFQSVQLKIKVDVIEVLCCPNMSQVKSPVSSTVNFPQ